MSLQNELGFIKPFKHQGHETVLNIVLTGSLLAKEGNRILRPFKLTEAQFNVLMLLKYQSVDGRINQTNLGNMMLVNRANITGLVDRMEEAGLVRRTADSEDRRVNYIEITDAGYQVLEKARKAYYSCLEEILAGLSCSDYSNLSKLLETVRENLRNT